MIEIRPVEGDEEWAVLPWLWQDFRHDIATIVNGFPYADGRYRHEWLDEYPGPGRVGYLAWAPHPNTGEPAPVAFVLVKGLDTDCHELAAMFVVPAARGGGLGTRMAGEVLARHPGTWEIAFQEDNHAAGVFWRRVADAAFGSWTEEARPVPDKPDVPPDHWIRGVS